MFLVLVSWVTSQQTWLTPQRHLPSQNESRHQKPNSKQVDVDVVHKYNTGPTISYKVKHV